MCVRACVISLYWHCTQFLICKKYEILYTGTCSNVYVYIRHVILMRDEAVANRKFNNYCYF